MSEMVEETFQQRMGRVEALLERVEQVPDEEAKALTREIVQSLLDLHGQGLANILETIFSTDLRGRELIDALARDELISHLLLLYDLHPLDLESRVLQAIAKVQSYPKSHGGSVELRGITAEGLVQLELMGNCRECPFSEMTIKQVIEDSIYSSAPEVSDIWVEGTGAVAPPPMPSLNLPLVGETSPVPEQGGWTSIVEELEVPQNEAVTYDVSGTAVIFLQASETMYAFENWCPSCRQALEEPDVVQAEITCRRCGGAHLANRAGQSTTDPQLYMKPLPLLRDRDQIRIALPIRSA